MSEENTNDTETTERERSCPDPAGSPLRDAIQGYMKNRLSLVESLGLVSFVYGENGPSKAEKIREEIERIDEVVGSLLSSENTEDVDASRP